MKKVILFAVIVLGFATAAQAQCAGKSGETAAASCCSKGKTSTAAITIEPAQAVGADIEQRTNASGEVSYVRKVVDASTGAVSFKEVEYCTKTNQFIDAEASLATNAGKKGNCADDAKSGCCSKSGSASVEEPAQKGKARGRKA